jgi:hypothetical protein
MMLRLRRGARSICGKQRGSSGSVRALAARMRRGGCTDAARRLRLQVRQTERSSASAAPGAPQAPMRAAAAGDASCA